MAEQQVKNAKASKEPLAPKPLTKKEKRALSAKMRIGPDADVLSAVPPLDVLFEETATAQTSCKKNGP
ncbi:hypothetical protein FALBO_13382 [Fusarium albosuccineum]|uniref:Uncharacterized protein n=1 Tax=Fusarium albosuccineum TaxID=1237068 RepID=A0A8H4L2E3_9HYPO|nr:hypothetical protein FALBO_13382 [Fusarium albosuccineum]